MPGPSSLDGPRDHALLDLFVEQKVNDDRRNRGDHQPGADHAQWVMYVPTMDIMPTVSVWYSVSLMKVTANMSSFQAEMDGGKIATVARAGRTSGRMMKKNAR